MLAGLFFRVLKQPSSIANLVTVRNQLEEPFSRFMEPKNWIKEGLSGQQGSGAA